MSTDLLSHVPYVAFGYDVLPAERDLPLPRAEADVRAQRGILGRQHLALWGCRRSEAAAEGGAAAAGLAALSSDLLGQVGLLLTRRPLAAEGSRRRGTSS